MTDSSNNILSVHNVSKSYMAKGISIDALHQVSLEIGPEASIGIIGPSGCGKSTLLLLMAGLEASTSGKLFYNGKPLSEPHKEIGLVLQEYGLFPWKTVGQNIELGLKIRKEKIDKNRILRILSELRIPDKIDIYPQQLSGGQKQRVALARAITLKPKILLLDEPFAALDTLQRERLQDLTAELCRSRRFGMVLVSHSIPEVVRLCRKILVMKNAPGEIIDIIDNPSGGGDAYRHTDEFHQMTIKIRNVLDTLDA